MAKSYEKETEAVVVRSGLWSGDALARPVGTLQPEEAHTFWSLLDVVEKIVKARKTELKSLLLEGAKETGEADSKGSKRVDSLGGGYTRQARKTVKIVDSLVEQLLEEREIPLKLGGDLVFVHDDKKLETLVATGRLTPNDVADCADVKTTYALVVEKPPAIKDSERQMKAAIKERKAVLADVSSVDDD